MKTKFIAVFIFLIGFSTLLLGQVMDAEEKLRTQNSDTIQGWRRGGVTTLNLAQTSLINWAAGGQNSFSVNGLLSLFANYKRDATVWDNSLDIGYGILKQENADYMKTDDKFDFLSKYGREAFGDFYYAALVNFRTQMTEGYNYGETDTTRISDLLAPAYLLGAIGLDYKPNKNFSAFVAPLTGKITIVNDQVLADQGAFGVEPGKKSKTEMGGYIRLIYTRNDFTMELLRNVSFTSKVDFFSNYLDKPQNIDVNWETQIALKVNRFLSVNINTHLIYDDDIDIIVDGSPTQTVQFKEILAVGFSYQF
jgi:hypothetical protein